MIDVALVGPVRNEVADFTRRHWTIPVADARYLLPLPSEFNSAIAHSLVDHVYEMWDLGVLAEELIARSAIEMQFPKDEVGNDIPHNHKDMGIAKYGSIANHGTLLQLSYVVRVKGDESASEKGGRINHEITMGKPNPGVMYDVVAARFVVGETDRLLYPRPHSGEYSPRSFILDDVLAFMTQREELYVGTEKQISQVLEYNDLLVQQANILWNHMEAKSAELDKKVSAFDSLDEMYAGPREGIFYDHLKEIAMVFDLYKAMQSQHFSHFQLNPFNKVEYTLKPKENGYGAFHLMFNLASGFTPVTREIQFRTGFQHVLASHREIAGHQAHKDAVNPFKNLALFTYQPAVQELMKKTFPGYVN